MFALPIINRTSAKMRFWIDKLVKPGSTMHIDYDFLNFLHLLGNQNPYGERPLHYTDLEDNPSMHSDFGFIKEFIEDNGYFQGTNIQRNVVVNGFSNSFRNGTSYI